ncbi:hypothetical protein HUU53_00510 [Candidatus Micrarchaeota archaeon]|nr:hypothetical protein [Candidatus Micrarchaeota archaeon]
MIQAILGLIVLASVFYAFYSNFKKEDFETALGYSLFLTLLAPGLVMIVWNLIGLPLTTPIVFGIMIAISVVFYYESKTFFLKKLVPKTFFGQS